jgi:transcriptional regulator with XRE-family HTH domain
VIALKFHESLKSYRANINVSQKEIARRLNVHPSHISRIENGERKIMVDWLPEIQKAYHIPDQQFATMLLAADAKTIRLQPGQAKELQSHYSDSLYNSNKELLYSDSFRYLFVCLSAMPPGQTTPFIRKITKDAERLLAEDLSKEDD